MTSRSLITAQLKQVLWFNRIFSFAFLVGLLIGAYFTKGTLLVVFPVTIGVAGIFGFMFNNALLGDLHQKLR